MRNQKTAILLLNIGSPTGTGYFKVATYLSRFLGERRVIDMPWFFRKTLVNCIIVPFRSFASSSRYKKLYTMYGGTFPLIKFGERNRQQLQELLEERATVFFATAYGNPSIKNTVKEICDRHFSSIFILPLFPHYASSSTEVVLEKTRKYIQQRKPGLQAGHITSFYRNPLFIEAFANRILSYHPDGYDHILFCYHSLPLKHIRAVENTEYCYTTACHETTRLIASRLSLEDGHYETVFQSRMSDQWQGPFAKERIIDIARSGDKKILLVAPSFVSDCLETALELGVEYQELFIRNGGKELRLVESLNHHPQWIRCLEDICRDNGI